MEEVAEAIKALPEIRHAGPAAVFCLARDVTIPVIQEPGPEHGRRSEFEMTIQGEKETENREHVTRCGDRVGVIPEIPQHHRVPPAALTRWCRAGLRWVL